MSSGQCHLGFSASARTHPISLHTFAAELIGRWVLTGCSQKHACHLLMLLISWVYSQMPGVQGDCCAPDHSSTPSTEPPVIHGESGNVLVVVSRVWKPSLYVEICRAVDIFQAHCRNPHAFPKDGNMFHRTPYSLQVQLWCNPMPHFWNVRLNRAPWFVEVRGLEFVGWEMPKPSCDGVERWAQFLIQKKKAVSWKRSRSVSMNLMIQLS